MATPTQVIDPLSIATHGLVGGFVSGQQVDYVNAITVATMGWIAYIEEAIIIEPEEEEPSGGGVPKRPKRATPRKKRKRFVVTVEVNGRFYTQTKYTSDLTISAKDVKVDIIERDGKPQLRVILPDDLER